MIPRVLIGIVCNKLIDAHFAMNLQDALVGNGLYFHADIRWAIGHITDDGRNEIAEEAIARGYDYLVFLDSDMTFPPGIVLGLLRRAIAKRTYSAAIYNTRSDHRVNLYDWKPAKKSFVSVIPNMDVGGVCDAGGTGAMCIPVRLFNKLKHPYFYYKYTYNETGRVRWSEDMVFCKKLLDKGYRCSYIPMVCGHIIDGIVRQVDAYSYNITKLSGEHY